MSEQIQTVPYVYQALGTVTHPAHYRAGRVWGVGGVHPLVTIAGCTAEEAATIVNALREMRKEQGQ